MLQVFRRTVHERYHYKLYENKNGVWSPDPKREAWFTRESRAAQLGARLSGKAPAAPSIIMYNHRGPTVLSFVSQIAEPPLEYNVESLGHWAIHCILRLPANTFFS